MGSSKTAMGSSNGQHRWAGSKGKAAMGRQQMASVEQLWAAAMGSSETTLGSAAVAAAAAAMGCITIAEKDGQSSYKYQLFKGVRLNMLAEPTRGYLPSGGEGQGRVGFTVELRAREA